MPYPKDHKMTAEEYFRTPETNKHIELRDGVIIEFESPTIIHQSILGGLLCEIHDFLKSNKLQDKLLMLAFDVKIDEYNVVQPDILVIRDLSQLDEYRCYGVPAFVVEIVSPDTISDYTEKLYMYYKGGAKEYWIIDPENEKVLVYMFEKSRNLVNIYTFADSVPVGIYNGALSINIGELTA